MDKLSKLHKDELVNDDPIIITLEEGRDFHCTRERIVLATKEEVELKSNNEWTQLGCYALLGYFMHWSGYLLVQDMVSTGFGIIILGLLVQMFVDSVLRMYCHRNWIVEGGVVLFVIGLCGKHSFSFYGLLAITITCLSIKICKRK